MPDQAAARGSANKTVYLKDYQPPRFLIDTVELEFELGEEFTLVHSHLSVRRNGKHAEALVLDGEELELLDLHLDGHPLPKSEYSIQDNLLCIQTVPDAFELFSTVRIKPQENTQLSGLYKSSGNFCTQCEAEGFRRITWFSDRPDVLARFKVRITADKNHYPVLLANGNPEQSGELENGKHWALWTDPWPKPSYLFALVAGDLAHIEDRFETRSGRDVSLRIYTEHHNIDQCEHAMRSLKKSMQWDEDVYGREYDLDVYNIVAVDDFNMGAMENKGLNIFNSKYVLAVPETATDIDYEGIEAVIGHEYFHNWSGNRVTCRDWFQLSLKEGFTVFRDQEFSADMGSRGVKRIRDVRLLRSAQFAEDAGPMAHPVRPESYEEINNFYTLTVYNKGAEVVRMLHHMAGKEGFRAGTDLYFDRHDGEAVTTEDFVQAQEDANQTDLQQFRLWYSQSGTPEILVKTEYDEAIGTARLFMSQSCGDTPGQKNKKPFHIPVVVEAYDVNGKTLVPEQTLSLTKSEQVFEFPSLADRPVFSVLRGFSAPVKLSVDRSVDDEYVLMRYDTDPFNRWEAFQGQFLTLMLDHMSAPDGLTEEILPQTLVDALDNVLEAQDQALAAEIFTLPPESYIASFCKPIDPHAIHAVRRALKGAIAGRLEDRLSEVYARSVGSGTFQIEPEDIGRRAIANVCLSYLAELDQEKYQHLVYEQYENCTNMTDRLAAVSSAVSADLHQCGEMMNRFYQDWKNQALVMDKWFSMHAVSPKASVVEDIRSLMSHEAFSIKNPNKVRSLIGVFANNNATGFHRPDGAGYHLVADVILQLDAMNPQIAARLMGSFNQWKKYRDDLAEKMREQIERVHQHPGLSSDVTEIAGKALA